MSNKLRNIKAVISKYGYKEFGMHDTISATRSLSNLDLMSKLNVGTAIMRICRYAERVAQEGESEVDFNKEIKELIKNNNDAKHIYIWVLDNLYAREVLSLLLVKISADDNVSKLLNII